jgi:hypothetical protein
MDKKTLILIFIVLVGPLAWFLFKNKDTEEVVVTNFEECVDAGNPVMESYPRQCRHGDEKFVEDIGNKLEKTDLIQLSSVQPNDKVKSPLTITGEARGGWFFEGDFPITLTTTNGEVVARGIATAKDDWMTSEFVSFESVLTFSVSEELDGEKGMLLLHKDNPSGLPENDDVLEVPVIFSSEEE